MSSQQQNFSTAKNVCVITNADSLLGYALAYRFLEAIRNKEDPESQSVHKLRILCHDIHGLGMKRLEEMGAEILQVNYKDESKLKDALKHVHSVILIPENSPDRLKEAENLIKAAKHQDVEHFGLMSIVGVDRVRNAENEANSNEFRNLKEYHQIEKKVKESFSGDKHCICRHQVFNQLYYFLSPQIEGENKFPLPVKKDCKWGSVNLIDVVEAVYCLVRKQEERRNGVNVEAFYRKNIYDFTLPRTLNGQDMAREVCQGLGRDEVRYVEISDNDFKKHLERMREDRRFKDRTDSHGKIEEGRDGWWSVPVGKFLNEQNIETMMEFWRLASKGQQDNASDDLKEILGRHPQSLKEYFKTNREQFKEFK